MSNVPLEIDVAAVKKKLDAGDDLLFVDCREAKEHATANIAAAKLIPMSEITDRLGELEPHKQKPLVVHCHHGGRSMRVVRWLREQGFTQAQNMTGGIDAWSEQIDPSVPRY
jgi:rhodanese-related sulfurtransferase